mmetsp:Transcript_10527/g.15482  ORF Transcript_10527/g.15482 Transcript_10527/m.15482 type:complete len:123 (+) Transcript_10527:11-379(+)
MDSMMMMIKKDRSKVIIILLMVYSDFRFRNNALIDLLISLENCWTPKSTTSFDILLLDLTDDWLVIAVLYPCLLDFQLCNFLRPFFSMRIIFLALPQGNDQKYYFSHSQQDALRPPSIHKFE